MIFWDISMGYLRQDQNNIYSRANFTHYWDNSLLYSLLTCVYKSFHFDREEQEFLLFYLSRQDCSIHFFQMFFYSTSGSFSTYMYVFVTTQLTTWKVLSRELHSWFFLPHPTTLSFSCTGLFFLILCNAMQILTALSSLNPNCVSSNREDYQALPDDLLSALQSENSPSIPNTKLGQSGYFSSLSLSEITALCYVLSKLWRQLFYIFPYFLNCCIKTGELEVLEYFL